MPRSHSRRSLLVAVGTAGVTGVAGCVGWLQRSAGDSQTLSVSESESAYTPEEFGAYVERMHDRYGPHGVWGDSSESPDLAFVGAWSDQWELGPEATEEKRIHVPIDAAVVLYQVGSSHQLWLWAGATPTQPDTGVGGTSLTSLSIGVELGTGAVGSYSPTSSVGPDDAPVEIGLDAGPSVRRPLPAGRIKPETTEGEHGEFTLKWAGGYGERISVAGVCELTRPPDEEYELTVTTDASASQGTL